MTLFVGRLENVLNYQLSSPIPRVALYIVYAFAAMLRGFIISVMLFVIFVFIFQMPLPVFGLSFCMFYLIGTLLFANVAIITNLYIKNWNAAGAVESYVIAPLKFFSGAFFPLHVLPRQLQYVIQINPLYHAINLMHSSYVGQSQTSFEVSLLVLAALTFLTICVCVIFFHKGKRLLR
jgi:ABC-2 type transport system permease protein